MKEKIAAFKQMLAENQAKRRLYTWLETTHVAYQGTVKVSKVQDCQFALAGPKPVCTEISLTQAPPPSGFIRRRIAEKKEEEMKAYMDTVRTLVAGYVPLNAAVVQQAYEQGRVSFSPDPATGQNRLSITGYKLPGDTITIAYTVATKMIHSIRLSTYVDKPSAPVTATVTFATLPTGVFYAYQKVLNVPSQEITVTITQTDFSELIEPTP